MRSIKVLIPVIIILIALTVVGIGIVSAQDDSRANPKNNKFVTKVANILGIDVIQVDEAFKQAREEIRNEMIENIETKFSIALENGNITSEKAKEKIDHLKNGKWIFPLEKFHHYRKDVAHGNDKHKFSGWPDKAKVKK